MKVKKALSFVFLCCVLSLAATADPLTRLEGTWYVNMSTFKMWLKGNKLNPKFRYAPQTKGGVAGLNDTVLYDKNNKEKAIKGFDKPLDGNATQFAWRGKGLLALFRSKWKILHETDDWTLIQFEKTLLTDDGYDVISRKKTLDEAALQAIHLKLKELGVARTLTVIGQS